MQCKNKAISLREPTFTLTCSRRPTDALAIVAERATRTLEQVTPQQRHHP